MRVNKSSEAVERAQLLNCIDIASPKASSEDQVVERLIESLYKLRDNRTDIVLLDMLGLSEDTDLRWLSAQWRKLVLVKPAGKGRAESVRRRYFELAVMHAVKDDLKSGDLFIKYGERYDDYREQLVDDETFEKEVGGYGQVTGIETDPGTFVTMLKSAMAQRARDIDAAFPENAHAEIVDGRLILRKPPRSEIVEAAARIDALDWNRRLWSALATDCSDPNNSMNAALKAQIISISLFVSRHSSAIMRGDDDFEALIDINKMVMQGLSGALEAA